LILRDDANSALNSVLTHPRTANSLSMTTTVVC